MDGAVVCGALHNSTTEHSPWINYNRTLKLQMYKIRCESHSLGSFVPGRKDQDSYFNISEMKLSIISLYIISDAPKYDIIWTENSDVIDSFISEILKYKSWILASWR